MDAPLSTCSPAAGASVPMPTDSRVPHVAAGFEEHYLPYMLSEASLLASGQLPKFRDNLRLGPKTVNLEVTTHLDFSAEGVTERCRGEP